jgi:endoglucanase
MDKGRLAFLERFLETISPSGFETEAAAVWRDEAGQFAERTWVDLHGNAFASLNESGAPRVMLAGHMDEIGLMVSHVTDSGYLYTRAIGGWDGQVLPGQRAWVRSKAGRVLGVIGRKPIHLLDDDDKKKVVKVEDLWIDIGATSKADALKVVEIGDPVVLAHSPGHLSDDLLVARGVDDRIGAFVALEALRLLKRLKPKTAVFAVATVQEEIGLRGARTSAYGLDPTVGIAVDVCHATDTPGTEGEKKKLGEITLGKGPVLARGPNINPRLFDLCVEVAKKAKVPYQIEPAPAGTGTDANAMQLSRAGMATALVSIPNRYMHSPCEVVSLSDVENAAKLIAHVVAALDATTDLVPGPAKAAPARRRRAA